VNRFDLRALWLNVHLWLGLTLGTVGIFVGISGSVLVYDHAVDAWLNPQRYSLADTQPVLPMAEYFSRASRALDGKARPGNLRMPEEEGAPLIVLGRTREGGGFYRVYMDPATGKILDVSQTGGLVGWLHGFHEHLQLREYGGRDMVGWVGVAMLISSLSGIYLWWPGRGRFLQALGMRPGLTLPRNLHYLFGFYAWLVLAMLSFTGIFLAWPEPGRNAVSALAPVSPSVRNVQPAEPPERAKRIGLEQALDTAKALYPTAIVSGVGLPNGPRGAYRVSFRETANGPANAIVVFLDPASGAVLRRTDPAMRTGGDAFLAAQRAIHTGEALGPLGRSIIFIVGLLPALFVVTGAVIWWKQRKRAQALDSRIPVPATSDP
jgi:uncharacterized iron-regulated membrane protein